MKDPLSCFQSFYCHRILRSSLSESSWFKHQLDLCVKLNVAFIRSLDDTKLSSNQNHRPVQTKQQSESHNLNYFTSLHTQNCMKTGYWFWGLNNNNKLKMCNCFCCLCCLLHYKIQYNSVSWYYHELFINLQEFKTLMSVYYSNVWQHIIWLLQLNNSTYKTNSKKTFCSTDVCIFPEPHFMSSSSETSTVPYESVMPLNTEWLKCQKWCWMNCLVVLEHSLTFDCKQMRCFDLYYLTLTNCNCSIKIINTFFLLSQFSGL